LLQDALPHTTAALVAGISKLMVPLKGGVLVPAPDIVVPGLPVDNQGTMTLPFTWPAGVPSGFEMWLQMWVAEPTSLQGFSATNGLHAVAP